MYKKGSFPQTETQSFPTATATPVVARISGSGNPGQVMVEHKSNPPVEARLLTHIDRSELTKPENAGREVLVIFEQGDPTLPIILGVMEKQVEEIVSTKFKPSSKPSEASVDGKKVTFSAEEEIELKCGKGSIHLNKEGEIVISGTKLISRATEKNKIKGGNVEMN